MSAAQETDKKGPKKLFTKSKKSERDDEKTLIEAMSDPYERVKGGRLAFKGGDLATRKSIEKKKKKKPKKNKDNLDAQAELTVAPDASASSSAGGDDIYSIDAAKKKKYDELFPVEAKKFGYVPKSNFDSVEKALDDRVTKKADRYCK